MISLRTGHVSITGNFRDNNEDNYFIDDGQRFLWLDLGQDGRHVSVLFVSSCHQRPAHALSFLYLLQQLDMVGCPKPVVFILHSILSAKLHRLGLIA